MPLLGLLSSSANRSSGTTSPGGLVAQTVYGTSVIFNFERVEGASSYTIKIYNSSGSSVVKTESNIPQTSNATISREVTGLSASTSYLATVAWVDSQGVSSPESGTVSFTTIAIAVPSTPSIVSISRVSDTQVDIQYTVSNVGSNKLSSIIVESNPMPDFEVLVYAWSKSDSSGASGTITVQTSGANAAINYFRYNTSYTFRIAARNQDSSTYSSWSSYSSSVTPNTSADVPWNPTLNSVSKTASTTLTFSLTPPYNGGSNITAYEYYWRNTSDSTTGQGTFFGLPTNNTYTLVDGPFVSGQTYEFEISASNSVGTGVKSNKVQVTY